MSDPGVRYVRSFEGNVKRFNMNKLGLQEEAKLFELCQMLHHFSTTRTLVFFSVFS